MFILDHSGKSSWYEANKKRYGNVRGNYLFEAESDLLAAPETLEDFQLCNVSGEAVLGISFCIRELS